MCAYPFLDIRLIKKVKCAKMSRSKVISNTPVSKKSIKRKIGYWQADEVDETRKRMINMQMNDRS